MFSCSLQNGTIYENGQAGIKIEKEGSADVFDSTISKNKEAGVWVLENGKVFLKNNTITENLDFGFALDDAYARLEDNVIKENQLGAIEATGKAELIMKDNTIEGEVKKNMAENSGNQSEQQEENKNNGTTKSESYVPQPPKMAIKKANV